MSEQPPRPTLDRLTAVMIVVVLLTLAGGYLLLSAAESLTLVDGAVEWQAESPLRAVVQLLCLNYQFPTILAGDIKGYVLGIGVAVALGALGIGLIVQGRELAYVSIAVYDDVEAYESTGARNPFRTKLPLLVAAQFLAILFVLWSFASTRWSQAPDIALAGSVLLALQLAWALVLGNSVGAIGVRYILRGFLIVTLLTSLVAVWYFYDRNPTIRAKFPFGNPTFLSACLIPGLIISLVRIFSEVSHGTSAGPKSRWFWLLLAAASLGIGLWAFILTGSRGAVVGLGAAVFAAAFFALRGRWKFAPIAMALVLGAWGWFCYTNVAKEALDGRSDTLRLRGYAWSYALRMFTDRPITGFGQCGFALLGDSFVPNDILDDPAVFDGIIDHAHNEWLETLSDLGIVGTALVAAFLTITLIGVHSSLRFADAEHRACLIGLAGALVGLVVEECAGVGLRGSEVPVAFYTVLGLAWAGSIPDRGKLIRWTAQAKWRGLALGALCLASALGAMTVTQIDFESARGTFDIQQLLTKGKLDDAVHIAQRGLWRLSPQRDLASRLQTANAYVTWAEHTIHRATERNHKAQSSEAPDARLTNFVHADIAMAEDAIRMGGHVLKELIERAPGYVNSGLMDYRINLVRAQAALLRGEHDASEASRKNAVAALDRELLRQPFNSELAGKYVRFAWSIVSIDRILTVLARPLRFEPVTDDLSIMLQQLAQTPDVQQMLLKSLDAPDIVADSSKPLTTVDARWKPELLRMNAAIDFMQGRYEPAASQLERAAKRYAQFPRPATLGEAATYVERAEAVFYANPEHPDAALKLAAQAIDLAPDSRLGREMQRLARQRMIQYRLAADQENDAIALLKLSATRRVADEILMRELGLRFRELTQSLLQRKPADSLFPKLDRWIRRAIELNPDDFAAHYIAANLALHAGDDAATATHLREALHAGLDPADAARCVQAAMERIPESAALKALAKELPPPADLASDNKEP